MGMLASTRRWMHDRMTSDENISGTPKEKINDLNQALPQLTPEERSRNLQHLRAYVDYYHWGHQREAVPVATQRSFDALLKEAHRLNAVDQARTILYQHGGPPTRETVTTSLERSSQQREKQLAQAVQNGTPPIQQTTAGYRPGVEFSWRDLQPKVEQKQEQKQERAQGQGIGVSV
jgi:hypothetical protein